MAVVDKIRAWWIAKKELGRLKRLEEAKKRPHRHHLHRVRNKKEKGTRSPS